MEETANIGLHQWAGTDPFLREDFNEDFRKIDTAVGRTERKADRALAGLAPVSYNVYNLLLRDYYEGKYTGFKRAIAFDGFKDGEGLSNLSPGAWLEDGRLWYCGETSALPLEMNFGGDAPYTLSANRQHTRVWRNAGHGRITGGALYLRNSFSEYYVRVTLACGEAESWATLHLKSENAVQLVEFTLERPLVLLPGHEVRMTVESLEEAIYEISIYGQRAGEQFGCRLTGSGTPVENGICLTVPFELGQAYGGALAWARYEGAPPALAVKNSAGARSAMTCVRTYPAKTLDGGDCMEAEYHLDAAPPAPNGTVTLELDLTQDGIGSVFDYGIVFQ